MIFSYIPLLHRVLICCFGTLIFCAVFFLPDVDELEYYNDNRLQPGHHYALPLKTQRLVSAAEPTKPQHLNWQEFQVREGESSALLFQRAGLTQNLLFQLINTNSEIKQQLTHIKPGDIFRFGFDKQQQLMQLNRPVTAYDTFIIQRNENAFISHNEKKTVSYQYNYAQATITSNFWNSAIGADLTPNQTMELAGIFGWDIDFALDIRSNDHFAVLYQEKILDGEVIGRGKIVAATFSNQGETFTAILDENSGNYYDPTGRAMKKAFLRSPIDFRRVSSNFNPRRLHPVTGQVVAHRGTDYVAPVGTPVWAAGDGVVQKSGYNQFNGNYVFIRHSATYITKYLHMKKRLVKTGQRVKQGQVIGQLGGTGRVTGPHLHYEFLVNGVHKNPRTVTLPQSQSLQGNAKARFLAQAEEKLQAMAHYQRLYSLR